MSSLSLLLSVTLLVKITFASNDYGYSNDCDYSFHQNDFDVGTIRILKSGKYCLAEDIVFNPLPGDIHNPNSEFKWFPQDPTRYPGCIDHTAGPFALGFFAAISIEADNVEIDLRGYGISMHDHMRIQQRWYSHIEVSNTAFIPGDGPTNFGPARAVSNIYIHDGWLGASSHHGIHSVEANNVKIERVNVRDFEVGGIQFNGFNNVILNQVGIGPSNTDVKASGYYSNAKFLLLAMKRLIDRMDHADSIIIQFSGGRKMSFQQIYDVLIRSMDIAFRHFIDETTWDDFNDILYDLSLHIFGNKEMNDLPDGSALYGLLFNSRGFAVFGYGDKQKESGFGENLKINKVSIHDLELSANEVPAMYFDECDGDFDSKTMHTGPFGDIADVRKMINFSQKKFDRDVDITTLKYAGNPLDDARIALFIIGEDYQNGGPDGKTLAYGSKISDSFLEWALDDWHGNHYEYLPKCTKFICNADIMLHTNKGIVGARFDRIEDVTISELQVIGLVNHTPLGSFSCGQYKGPDDGGNPAQLEGEGFMAADVAGMTQYSGDITFEYGTNVFKYLVSDNGATRGIHTMNDALLIIDDFSNVIIEEFSSGNDISQETLKKLIENGEYPYPNKFYECNIYIDPVDDTGIDIIGYNDEIYCNDNPDPDDIEIPGFYEKTDDNHEFENEKHWYHDYFDGVNIFKKMN